MLASSEKQNRSKGFFSKKNFTSFLAIALYLRFASMVNNHHISALLNIGARMVNNNQFYIYFASNVI